MNEGEIEIYSMACNTKNYPEKTVLLGGFMSLCVIVIMQEIDRRRVLGKSGCSSFGRTESKNLTMLFVSKTERMCSAWNYGLEPSRCKEPMEESIQMLRLPSQNTAWSGRSNA